MYLLYYRQAVVKAWFIKYLYMYEHDVMKHKEIQPFMSIVIKLRRPIMDQFRGMKQQDYPVVDASAEYQQTICMNADLK